MDKDRKQLENGVGVGVGEPGTGNRERETLADIAADIRDRAVVADRHGEAETSNESVAALLRDIANRIDAAATREAGNAAPARNCDRLRNTAQALGAYRDGPPIGEEWGAGDWMQLLDWLFATEDEKEGCAE